MPRLPTVRVGEVTGSFSVSWTSFWPEVDYFLFRHLTLTTMVFAVPAQAKYATLLLALQGRQPLLGRLRRPAQIHPAKRATVETHTFISGSPTLFTKLSQRVNLHIRYFFGGQQICLVNRERERIGVWEFSPIQRSPSSKILIIAIRVVGLGIAPESLSQAEGMLDSIHDPNCMFSSEPYGG